jgi:phosphatidylserine decarboxylase
MLASQGQAPAAAVVLVTAFAAYQLSPWWLLPGLAIVVAVVWAFYEPLSTTPSLPLAAVSPLSARVQSAGIKVDPWLRERQALRITMRTMLPGIATIRAPLEGKVMDFWVRGGISKDDIDGSPTCYTLWVQTDEGDDVVVAVHGRRRISRFRAIVAPGERVGHGRPLGFIYFATAVTLYLPASSECELTAGELVSAGETILGTLVREAAGASR